jgi:phospholipase C
MRPRAIAALALVAAVAAIAGGWTAARSSRARTGLQTIRHVIVIMQENRSFDSYFGTFPGADGIAHAICVPNGVGGCVRPFHDPRDRSGGGAHGPLAGMQDVDGGKMDGFIRVSFGGLIRHCRRTPAAASCAILRHPGLMGYYDARELPNYWA